MSAHEHEDPTYDPQNPPPDETAGLEPGGGVKPGDTPPAETGVGGPNYEPPTRGRAVPMLIIGIAAVVVLIIAVGMFSRIFELF